jgi:site-specific DNA-methyltransferase (adenine-specific)
MIHNCDCMEFMRGMEAESVDCVLTDPPYSSGGAFRGDRNGSTRNKYQSTSTSDVKPEFYGDNRDQRSLERWVAYWGSECWRIMKPGGFFMCFIDWQNLAAVIDALQMAGFVYRGVFSWNKTNARPQKGIFRNDTEFVVYGTKGPTIQMEKYAKGYYQCMPKQTRNRIHSTEKPVELLEHLLQFVPEGGLVFDPFAGSGSTGEACARLGLRFEGCELSEEYARLANERLEALERQPLLDVGA